MEKKLKDSIKNEDVVLNPITEAKSLFGLFRVSDTAPTGKPTRFIDQVVIYTNSTTYRIYWYDQNANVWHYVSATA
jgi:hypothetical protein